MHASALRQVTSTRDDDNAVDAVLQFSILFSLLLYIE